MCCFFSPSLVARRSFTLLGKPKHEVYHLSANTQHGARRFGDIDMDWCYVNQTGAMLIRLFRSVWPFGSFGIVLCKTSLYIALVSFLACIFSLVGITIDRFMAVSRPLKLKPWSKWTKMAISVIWVTSFLLPVGKLLEIDEIPNQSGNTTCSATISHANFMILASCFLLPFTLMTVLYPMISHRLWKRKVPEEFNAQQQQIAYHTARRVTLLIIRLWRHSRL